MARLISITDDKRRDAQVVAQTPARPAAVRYVAPGGGTVRAERLIRATDATHHDALLRKFETPPALARALAEGDPDVPLEVVGRRLGYAARVYLRADGTMLSVPRFVLVVKTPDGAEKSRADLVDVEATVSDEVALPWTGRLVPVAQIVRKVAFARQLQLRHNSGLTFEFLYDIAKTLHAADKMLVVGAGAKGQQPLIFTTNGAPFRGFLEGRVDGDAYRLVLHLSNLELKAPAAGGDAAAAA